MNTLEGEKELKEAQRRERETARAKRVRKAAKGHGFLAVKGNGQDGHEATLQITLTHGLWLDLRGHMIRAYVEARESRGRNRARKEVNPGDILGAGIFLDDMSVQRTMALYESAWAAWGDRTTYAVESTPTWLAGVGEAREAKAFEDLKGQLLAEKSKRLENNPAGVEVKP